MPSIPIRGARIHYETYGEHRAGVPPVLLVHGSYITGSVDWGEVAPMLAEEAEHGVPTTARKAEHFYGLSHVEPLVAFEKRGTSRILLSAASAFSHSTSTCTR